jgi:hypothetical protein
MIFMDARAGHGADMPRYEGNRLDLLRRCGSNVFVTTSMTSC